MPARSRFGEGKALRTPRNSPASQRAQAFPYSSAPLREAFRIPPRPRVTKAFAFLYAPCAHRLREATSACAGLRAAFRIPPRPRVPA
jgi:hypothetical protein